MESFLFINLGLKKIYLFRYSPRIIKDLISFYESQSSPSTNQNSLNILFSYKTSTEVACLTFALLLWLSMTKAIDPSGFA